ncbi:MAG: response regulator [Pseudomonadota bacterium]
MPVDPPPPVVVAPPVAAPPPVAAAPARARYCLLVDDSRVIRKVAHRIIAELGYQVIEAENGEEALARCKASMPDLILLDWEMPVMTGVEFIAALRRIDGGVVPKVVFCTSKAETIDIYQGIGAGADEYVTKPFDQHTLLAKLQRIGAA